MWYTSSCPCLCFSVDRTQNAMLLVWCKNHEHRVHSCSCWPQSFLRAHQLFGGQRGFQDTRGIQNENETVLLHCVQLHFTKTYQFTYIGMLNVDANKPRLLMDKMLCDAPYTIVVRISYRQPFMGKYATVDKSNTMFFFKYYNDFA